MESRYVVRPGGPGDSSVLLALFDDSIAWMVERGLTAQWGATPFSMDPKRIAACERWCEPVKSTCAKWAVDRPLRSCWLTHRITLSQAWNLRCTYVLVGSHEPFARGAGAHLLERA